jgi:hypothetical protein
MHYHYFSSYAIELARAHARRLRRRRFQKIEPLKEKAAN